MYNGEVNAQKLENWVRQLEVYCRIQSLQDDDIKIELASLRMDGATLILWEEETQEEIKNHGKISIYWSDFIAAIKRQFYPIAYMQKSIIRQLKGQNMQDYTQEFRRRSLMLGVYLQSQDTLLKYIGVLHSYLRHSILMFNPNNLDDVRVQATDLEVRGKSTPEEGSKNPFKGKEKEKGFKGKGKKNASIKKEGENITCKHCSKEGDDEAHCWKLHPKMKPKKFNNKGAQKTTTTTQ